MSTKPCNAFQKGSNKSEAYEKIINARKILVLDYPFWGNLVLRLSLLEDESCPTGWTDGKHLAYNPHWIANLSHEQTVGWCAHEVCHCMCMHHLRRAGRNHKLWNRAGDYVINSILNAEKFSLPGRPLLDLRFDGMDTDSVFKILEMEYEIARQKIIEKVRQEQRSANGEEGSSGEEDGSGNTANEKSNKDKKDRDKNKDKGKNEKKDKKNKGKKNKDKKNKGKNEKEKEETKDDDEESDESDGNALEDTLEDTLEDILEDILEDMLKDMLEKFDSESLDPGESDCGEVRDHSGDGGLAPSESELKEQEQNWKIATIQAATQSKMYGNLPGELKREIKNIVDPKVDPKELLQQFIAMSAKNNYTWSAPNRRHIYQELYLPSLKSEELGTVVIAVDTSGSISEKEFDNFAAVLSAILESYKVDITVLYCDTKVYEPPEYFNQDDLPIKLKARGYGGTDLSVAFDYVRDHDIDPVCFIYFTDLECNVFPSYEPFYPVMWVCTGNLDGYWVSKPPFGEVIHMELEEY